jgi:hypothetical protein
MAVSVAAKIAKEDPDTQRMVVEKVKDGSEREAVRAIIAVKRQKRDDERKAALFAMTQERVTFDATREAPIGMLGNRPLRITRDAEQRRWTLEIGPNIDAETFERRKQRADRDDTVAGWQRKRDDLLSRAADLEIQARKLAAKSRRLRSDAAVFHQQMNRVWKLIEQEHGRVHFDSEIIEFEADLATEIELAALPQDQSAQRLVAAHAAQETDSSTNGHCKPLTRVGHSWHWGQVAARWWAFENYSVFNDLKYLEGCPSSPADCALDDIAAEQEDDPFALPGFLRRVTP